MNYHSFNDCCQQCEKQSSCRVFFDAPNAHENMREFARSPPAAFDQGVDKFKQTIREAVEEAD
jgi:hypothetical protein